MSNPFLYSFKVLNICFLFATIISGQETCKTPAWQSGFCVPFMDCPLAKDLIKSYGSIEAISNYYLRYFNQAKCSGNNEPIRVCCTLPKHLRGLTPSSTAAPVQANEDLVKDLISQFDPKQKICITPSGQNGFCMPYEECPFVKDLSQYYKTADDIPQYYLSQMTQSICSRDNEPIRLCCTLSNNSTRSTTPPTPKSKPTPRPTPVQVKPKFGEDMDNTKDLISQFKGKEQSCSTPVLQKGFCVPYEKCLLVQDLIWYYGSYEAIPKYYLFEMIKSRCSKDNEPIRLCCSLANNYTRPTTSTTPTPVQVDSKLNEGLAKDLTSLSNPKEENCTTSTMQSGFCVPYEECPFVKNLLEDFGSNDSIPEYYLNHVLKSKCSRDNEPIRVCCNLPNYIKRSAAILKNKPSATSVQSDPLLTEDLDYTQDFISQFNPTGLSILSQSDCGYSEGDRLAGGKVAKLAEFPWMALLRYDSPSNEYKCGGSLISNRYVLTATHCVNQPVYPVIGVVLGEYDFTENLICRGVKNKICNPMREDFGIEKIIIHPRYNKSKHVNDIALLKLDRTVALKKHIKPVCLPITQPSLQFKSNNFIIAGWGATEKSKYINSNVLMKAFVQGYTSNVCQQKFNIEINPKKQICAGDLQTGRDTCEGDSGGPLIASNLYISERRFIQYGIVASGGGNCNLEQKFPGLYTNVLTFIPWITSNIVE